ncbi:MAG TPA: helix-hairpin-helix domain-containing protein [Geobacteraceae bacterium]|nr:helix-hairpin-helix domain-containing protein [Geobacteraceae bacterium]
MTTNTQADKLTRIKGIGDILAQRLNSAGLNTFAKIAAAPTTKLAAIPGMNPRAVDRIIEQAATFASVATTGSEERAAALKMQLGALRDRFSATAADLRVRFADELSCKAGRLISREFVRIMDLLTDIDKQSHTQLKRAEKRFAKATKRCDKLATASISGARKRLKKMRKSLDKVIG